MKKTYNISVVRFFDKSVGETAIELTATKEFTDLLKNFAIMNKETMKTTGWIKSVKYQSIDDEENTVDEEYTYYKRYRLNSTFFNSVNNIVGWANFFDLVFVDEFLENQKIKAILNNTQSFNDIENRTDRIKYLVSTALELLTDKKLNINISVNDKEAENE